jgi:hypothetical protein
MAAGKEWMLDSDMAPGIIDAASSAETDVAPPIRFVNLLWISFALAAMLAVLSFFSCTSRFANRRRTSGASAG